MFEGDFYRAFKLKDFKDKTVFILFIALVGTAVIMLLENYIYAPPFMWWNWVGFVLLFFGIAVRTTGRLTLGKFFTYQVRVQKEHKVIKEGIYKKIRHPMYTGYFLMWLGAALALSSFFGLILWLTCVVPALKYRTIIEERFLAKKLGKEYSEYMKQTGRFLPRLLFMGTMEKYKK
ncbi:isoprenylcysteine carboxylmethyltransferase family protein [Candidatus Woesearchaeota archaeon]|nr:isoprenylcysteine carboxylmethyltransferase family protein [Candidatus Woesearchaeota archaeon]